MATKPFNGTINVDIKDSVPDWNPYAQPEAADGAPSVLYIVLDDVGFAAMEPWGGLIETPNINRLAATGLTYTNWHTTALCSPTRSSLLTGRNHTTNGMACIAEATSGFPGSNGHIPFECATIAEVLGERGWNTYMLGKWHLCPADELNMASTKRNWPVGRGFERYYGFLGGETNQWYPDLVYDNHYVDQPKGPEDGYHLTTDLTDKAIGFIRDAKVVAPDKPFFMYFCPGATHAPHHAAPKEWIAKYQSRFDEGYEAYREQVFERQKTMGILPQHAELSPINPYADTTSHDGKPWPQVDTVRPWESLSEQEKTLFRRMAEVYAGFLSHTDHEIGRLLDYLAETGQLENTIVVLVSDNGASAEGGPNGSVNENKFFNGIPDDMAENLKYLDELGGPDTYNHYPSGWACAFNTPFKMWKRYNFEGGVADPMIVSWPQGIRARGEVRHQYNHATDVVPTIYDCLGIELPDQVKGYPQIPLEGQSFRYSFDAADAPTQKESAFFTMLGSRAIWHQGWKAVTAVPAAPGGWSDHMRDRWELYHTTDDPTEMHDLADQHPEKLQELIALWFYQAGLYNGLPIESQRHRDPRRRAANDRQAPGPLHLLPRLRRGPRGGSGQRPQPVLHNRRRGPPQHPGRRRGAVLPRRQVRRARPLHQGRQAQVRLQLLRDHRADRDLRTGRAHRYGHPVGRLRPRGHRHAHPRHAHPLHRRQGRRLRPDPDPARPFLPLRRGTQRRQGRRRTGH
jgi:arylsulfatase A-like enzyme